MTLAPGTQFGPYRIDAALGAGGMGEVYRARDTRLDRDVAIKVLPEAVARDSERLLRFEREAKLLASLSHTSIAAVYGFEDHQAMKFLVLEYVEGETLASRLKRGRLPIDETLEACTQIAQALEAAHEKGIIHRDLKPGNVMLRPDGTVKVLDFGLARAMTNEPGSASGSLAESPTITALYTRPGVVLGTAAYMSPEQARGKPIDKRTDIWSFGVLLYECLSGKRPFRGETNSDLMARILEREPDWSDVPAPTPPLVQLLLRRCLAKDRNKRLRDIGDARVDLETALTDPTSSGLLLAGAALASGTRKARRGLLYAALLVPVLLLGMGLGWRGRPSHDSVPSPPVVRFTIDQPPQCEFRLSDGPDKSSFTLDPSGKMLAFTASSEGESRLYVRHFAAGDSRALPGTEGADDPFFSPDSRWLGYSTGGKLFKIPVGGGPALTLCDTSGADFAWLEDGTIVFEAPNGQALLRVSDRGGTPTELAQAGHSKRSADGSQLLLGFLSLCPIPGADYLVAGVWDGDTNESYALVSVSLADGTVQPLMSDGIDPYYIDPGYLLFLRGASILEAPFDARERKVTGEAVQVMEGVVSDKWADEALFAASTSGTIAYIPGGRRGPGRRLIRVDATGKAQPLMDADDAIVGGLRVSPNGEDLLVTTLRRNIDLWNVNLARQSRTLLNNVGESWGALWTPDGQAVVFMQHVPEKPRILVRTKADGSGALEPVPIEYAGMVNSGSFSPDGTKLLVTLDEVSPQRRSDIAVIHWGQPGPPEVVLGSSADESGPQFAPDGKHFAYMSNEAGRYEVFVRALSDPADKWQISHAGGYAPVWSPDGKKLYFLDRNDVMFAVSVDLNAGPQFSSPEKLFDTKTVATTDLWGVYDVLPDGAFVMVQPADWEKQTPRIHVVLNWREELLKR